MWQPATRPRSMQMRGGAAWLAKRAPKKAAASSARSRSTPGTARNRSVAPSPAAKAAEARRVAATGGAADGDGPVAHGGSLAGAAAGGSLAGAAAGSEPLDDDELGLGALVPEQPVVAKKAPLAKLEAKRRLVRILTCIEGGVTGKVAIAEALKLKPKDVSNVLRYEYGSLAHEQSALAALEADAKSKALAAASRRATREARERQEVAASVAAAQVVPTAAVEVVAGGAAELTFTLPSPPRLDSVLPMPAALPVLPVAAAPQAKGRKKGKQAAPVTKYVMKRVNVMGGPLGKNEEEDGPDIMPRARKVTLVHAAIDAIDPQVAKLHAEWRVAGSHVAAPPYITTASGGCEAGEKHGKIHAQLTFEVGRPPFYPPLPLPPATRSTRHLTILTL